MTYTIPKIYSEIILQIDPSADVELVADIADENYRYLAEMSRSDWLMCIRAAKFSA